jgi:hypothetical protein
MSSTGDRSFGTKESNSVGETAAELDLHRTIGTAGWVMFVSRVAVDVTPVAAAVMELAA